MNRISSTSLLAAFSLLAALAATACTADAKHDDEGSDDQTSELTDAEKAVLDENPVVDTSSSGTGTHSASAELVTSQSCVTCGPLPDPWKKTAAAGPLPDPWKSTSSGTGTGTGTGSAGH